MAADAADARTTTKTSERERVKTSLFPLTRIPREAANEFLRQ